MLHGKHTCEQLKAIRQQIADANGIDYTPAQCTHDGPCRGTCPRCEAEKSYLEQQLSLKAKAGQAIKIIGVAASLVASASAQQLSAQEVADSAVVDTSLTWDSYAYILPGQTGYRPEDSTERKEMAALIDEYPDRLYLMIGHTTHLGKLPYNLKLSQKDAEWVCSLVLEQCQSKNVQLIPVGLADFVPLTSKSETDVVDYLNSRRTLVTYSPLMFKGQASTLVELAIYKTKFPDKDHVLQIYKWEQQIEKLRTKPDSDKLTAEYDSLAQEIHTAWSK